MFGSLTPEPEVRTIGIRAKLMTVVAMWTPMPQSQSDSNLKSSRYFLGCDEDKLRIVVSSE